MSDGPAFTRLISDHLDGVLDDAGRARLEAWLASDPTRRRRFVRMAMDHAALHRLTSVMAAKPPTLRTRRILARRRPQPWLVPLALAAGLILAIGGGWLGSKPAQPSDRRPLLLSAHGTTALIGSRLAAGVPLRTDAEGSATLRWDDGSEVRLAASTEVAIGDSFDVRLVRGRVAAVLAPQPSHRPARFTTSEAEILVLGTSLAIAAGEGESSAEVSHGRVRVRHLSDGGEVTVSAGECVVIAPGLALRVRPIGSPAGVVHHVPPGGMWPDQALLQPGDLIALAAGVHPGAHRLTASGTSLRPIVVRGAGVDATVLDASTIPTSGEHGDPRGVLQVEGRHIAISDLTLRGAHNKTANAAGLRLLASADDIALTGCRVDGCDSGVNADPGPGHLLIENCIITGNGIDSSVRSTPNLQLANRQTTVRGCRISEAPFGVNVALHDGSHRLIGNRISGGAAGEIRIALIGTRDSSIELIGNLVSGIPRPKSSDRHRFISLYRGKHADGVLQLTIHACTLVAGEPLQEMIDAPGCTVALSASILTGSSRLATPGTRLTGLGNCLPDDADAAGLTETLRGVPGFIDEAAGDYRLLPTSPCRGAAPATPPPPALTPPGITGEPNPRSGDRNIGAY